MPRFQPRKPNQHYLSELSLDGWENAVLPASAIDWHSYAYCYRRAADELVAIFTPPAIGPDGMLLPILFLYRHYLEVSLKGLIIDCADVLGVQAAPPGRHDLSEIWSRLAPLLTRALPGSNDEWLARLETLVTEFQKLDPTSQTFRYPVGKDGRLQLVAGFQVSLPLVKETMKDIYFVLDAAAGLLEERQAF